jgi:hypothetical protein
VQAGCHPDTCVGRMCRAVPASPEPSFDSCHPHQHQLLHPAGCLVVQLRICCSWTASRGWHWHLLLQPTQLLPAAALRSSSSLLTGPLCPFVCSALSGDPT